MKRYIRIAYLVTFFLTILVVLTASFTLFTRENAASARRSLQGIIGAVKATGLPQDLDRADVARQLSLGQGQLRVTILDSQGIVLGDSAVDAQAMENHLSRPEIEECLKNGYGEDIRASETTGVRSLYLAARMQDGELLRLSIPLSATRDFVTGMLPTTLVVCLVLFLFIYCFSEWFSGRLTGAFARVGNLLSGLVRTGEYREEPEEQPVFSELVPAMRDIRSLAQRLQDGVAQIERKQAELDTILKTALDGIVLLARDGQVVLINDAARRILSAPMDAETFRGICRDGELRDQVEAALKDGAARTWELDMGLTRGKYFRVFINPARDHSGITGAVLILSDVTDLVRLERMRAEFVANVTHELKSPLTSIKGFAELMQAGLVADSETQADYLSRILYESERLLSIINDILRLSELESVRPTALKEVELSEIAGAVRKLLSERAEQRGIEIRIAGKGCIWAETEPVRELLYNLVDNSIKYGRENGWINITIRNENRHVILCVEDNGIGIAQEDQPRVFERFYRADKARGRKSESTGLGLAIVKHTADRYGGTVRLQSELGKYTRIEVCFPADG